jgi:pyruvate/2-oxoglutarate dehydrogenase complex dihydrolipoamide dehydrogenase (E3) component
VDRHDLIVVGGGAAGLVTAAGAAGIGARVVLVERERLGGECLWTGCVPSKALLACAKAAAHARGARRFGVRTEVTVDFEEAMRWVHAARVGVYPHDSPERFRGLGVEVIEGEARFTGPHAVQVGARTLTAPRIVIATGSRPAIPAIPGLDAVPYFTNETIFENLERPGHLLILGAGAIGVELAQAFVRLGSRVTVLEHSPEFLRHEEPELASRLRACLVADGVDLRVDTAVTGARFADGGIGLAWTSGGESGEIVGSHLLVATGREPRTDTMDLAVAGVEATREGITVDAGLRTTAPGIWACGDCVAGAPRLTHVADQQARLVIRNAFFPLKGKVDYSAVPWVTYTDPELAHVGLTEREARLRHGSEVRVYARPFDDVDRAIAEGETAGMVKLVTTERGRLVGGHILGAGAGDMIGEVALAVRQRMSVNALASLVHAYPTMPEAIRQAAEGHTKARFTGAARSIARWFARR